jgi:hypothetical protein
VRCDGRLDLGQFQSLTHLSYEGHTAGPRDVSCQTWPERGLADVCNVCRGGSCFFLSSGAVPPELAVHCPGSGALRSVWRCYVAQGVSAGNLLQGAQGCLQGHIHSVADGFRVVWHRVTSALQRQGRCTFYHSLSLKKFIVRPSRKGRSP